MAFSFLVCRCSSQLPSTLAQNQYQGDYIIYGCNFHGPAVNAALSQTLTLLRELSESLDSAEAGGNPIYEAFFSDLNPGSITFLLDLITSGAPIQKYQGYKLDRPVLICADPRIENTLFLLDICVHEPQLKIAVLAGYQFIFVCPPFFDLPLLPSASQCPRLVAAGTKLDDMTIIETQYTLLVHVLVNAYLINDVTHMIDEVNMVLAMSAEEAVGNPGSYAWYTAYVAAGCNQIPHPIRPYPYPYRYLAESDTKDLGIFNNVTVPLGCANSTTTLLKDLGMCEEAKA